MIMSRCKNQPWLNQVPKNTYSLYSSSQKLQEMGSKKKKLTVYEVLRNETIDLLDNLFRYSL